jgi:NAD(P)-dependent dehydrogenase (short-subunit alcohol dehydrogenase family)
MIGYGRTEHRDGDGMSRFDGAVAVVTGAGRGIGAETARTLARQGARVALLDIDGEAVAAVAKEIGAEGGTAVGRRLDVASEDGWVAAVEAIERELGPITLLHSNAAMTEPDSVGRGVEVPDLPLELWQRVMTVNAAGSGLLAAKHVLPSMLRAGRGSIVFTSSVLGLVGKPDTFPYTASKGAVIAFARGLAAAYGARGVRCNVVAPGPVETAATADIDPALKAALVRNSMIPRFADPADIANAVAFLLSDESAFITAQVLTVDGGMTAAYPTASPA